MVLGGGCFRVSMKLNSKIIPQWKILADKLQPIDIYNLFLIGYFFLKGMGKE